MSTPKTSRLTTRAFSAILGACCCFVAAPDFAAAQTAPADPILKTDPVDYGNWYELDAPTSADYALDDIFTPREPILVLPFVDRPIEYLIRKQEDLYDRYGLRVGFAYTSLYQQATGGPGSRWGWATDLDLMFDWTLVGRGTPNTGRFVFSVEERYRNTGAPQTPSNLRNEIGSLVGTTGAFNDRGLVVRDAFWDQRLYDDRLRVLVGRAAPDDYVGSHKLQSSNFGFFNGNFSGNVTTPWPGHGPMALVSVRPTDWFYATLGGANAYSTTTQMQVSSLFDEGKIFTFGEVGVTPTINGLGRGQYAVTLWYMPERENINSPEGQGISVTLQQYLSDTLWCYARYGYADGDILGVESAYQVGMAVDGLLGSRDNLTGLALGFAQPSFAGGRDETSIEVFQRFQLTRFSQFTVGAQAIIDPSNAPDKDVIGVFSFRLRFVL